MHRDETRGHEQRQATRPARGGGTNLRPAYPQKRQLNAHLIPDVPLIVLNLVRTEEFN